MLTATPVQNDLKELYNLIGLIKPGQLGSYQTFKKRFMAAKRTPKNPAELRRILDQVMIRNRREEGEIRFTERIVHPLIVTLGPKEQEIYKRVTEFIKARGRRTGLGNMLPLITCLLYTSHPGDTWRKNVSKPPPPHLDSSLRALFL